MIVLVVVCVFSLGFVAGVWWQSLPWKD